MAFEGDGPSDEALLERFLEGDKDAFSTLVRRYETKIFNLCLRIVGERSEALDATQDAFVSAFRRARTFRGEAAFSTWLYRIGINACNDLLRKRKRSPVPEEPETLARHEGRATGAPLEEQVTLGIDLQAALRALPIDYREAVVMHDLGGIPYEEIARVTGVAVGTVKSRISRGRQRLAALLEPKSARGASKERS